MLRSSGHDVSAREPATALLVPESSCVRLDRRICPRGGSGTGRASIAHYPRAVICRHGRRPPSSARRVAEGAARMLVVEDEPALSRRARTRALRSRATTSRSRPTARRRSRPRGASGRRDRARRADAGPRRPRGVPPPARRAATACPILMLTARAEVADRVEGLDAGADDYLVKPFALDELLARLRALLGAPATTAGAETLCVRRLELDPGDARGTPRRASDRADRDRVRPARALPAQPAARADAHASSSSASGGTTSAPSSNSLDVYIGYLRRKTEAGGEPRLIQTVRGVGYVLREP